MKTAAEFSKIVMFGCLCYIQDQIVCWKIWYIKEGKIGYDKTLANFKQINHFYSVREKYHWIIQCQMALS